MNIWGFLRAMCTALEVCSDLRTILLLAIVDVARQA